MFCLNLWNKNDVRGKEATTQEKYSQKQRKIICGEILLQNSNFILFQV